MSSNPVPPPTTATLAAAASAAYSISPNPTLLAAGQYNGPQVPAGSGLTMIGSPKTIDNDGFGAATYKDANGNLIIAFEGTNTSAGAFTAGVASADAQLNAGQRPQALQDAINYANSVAAANPGAPIFVAGHSLGGTEAEAVAQALGPVIAGGSTFGATGLPGTTNGSAGQLINYIEAGDPVGNYASDNNSALSPIAPGSMAHWGTNVVVGDPADATQLQQVVQHVQAAEAVQGLDPGVGAFDTFTAAVAVAGAVPNHFLAKYVGDVPSNGPGTPPIGQNAILPTTPGPDLALYMAIYGVPLGQGGPSAQTSNPTTDDAGDISWNGVTVSESPATGQISISTTDSSGVQTNSVILSGDNGSAAGIYNAGVDIELSESADGSYVITGSSNISNITATAGSRITLENTGSGSDTLTGNDLTIVADQGVSANLTGTGDLVDETGSGTNVSVFNNGTSADRVVLNDSGEIANVQSNPSDPTDGSVNVTMNGADDSISLLGAEGPSVRKRTVAYCTQC